MMRSSPITYLILALIMMIISQETVFAGESNIDFSQSTVNVSAFLKMFLGLVGVIVLIFVLAWLSRRMKLVQNFASGYQIKNLATLSLSTREKICLIDVAGKQLLVGVAPGNISQLHVFEEKIEIQEEDSSAKTNNLFSGHLKKALHSTITKGGSS